MKKFYSILIFVFFICSFFMFSNGKNALKAKDIIARCAEAMGGVKKIQTLKTLRFFVEYPKHKYIIKTEIKRPHFFRSTSKSHTVIFDGKNACIINKNEKTNKPVKLTMMKDKDMPDFFAEPGFFTFYFFDFPSQYLGTEKINREDAYKLEVKFPLEVVIHYFISCTTNLPVRTVAHVTVQGKQIEWVRDYVEYKEVDGIIYPHSFIYFWDVADKKKAFVKKVEFNVNLPDDYFKIPMKIK